jgi:hypothetical protein
VTTSIRDLLEETIAQLPTAATQARQTIGTAAAVLDQIQNSAPWRADWRPTRHTRQLTEDLAHACRHVHAGNLPTDPARQVRLLAIAGDAIGTLCGPATPAADRWAIATTVADIVRRCTTIYTETGPTLPDRAVHHAHDRAVAILLAGRHLEPNTARCILDLPIPSSTPVPADPLSQAVAAAEQIDYRIARRGSLALPEIRVYELRAVALAFTAAMDLAHTALPDTTPAPAKAWRKVHQLSRHLHDGAQPSATGPEPLLRHAIHLQRHITRLGTRAELAGADTALCAIADHAANTAASLIDHTHKLAGALYAHAHQYPVPETRAAEHLRRQPFILDTTDVSVLGQALRDAATVSGQLAGTATDSWDLGNYPQLQRIQPLPTGHQPHSPSI